MVWFVLLIAAICLVIFFIFLKKRQDALEESFQNRFAGKIIRIMDKHALYVARKSDGYSHVRGIGYLVLTEEELYFERQLDRKITIIPTDAISSVGSTKRLAGQSPGQIMLKVEFDLGEGNLDEIAWKVKDLESWEREIAGVTS